MNKFYHSIQQKEAMSQALQKAQITLITNIFQPLAVNGEEMETLFNEMLKRDCQLIISVIILAIPIIGQLLF